MRCFFSASKHKLKLKVRNFDFFFAHGYPFFSRVFHHLIIKHQHMQHDSKKAKKSSKSSKKSRATTSGFIERLVIPVRKYDAEVFRMLVQFVHSGSAYITQENVSGN